MSWVPSIQVLTEMRLALHNEPGMLYSFWMVYVDLCTKLGWKALIWKPLWFSVWKFCETITDTCQITQFSGALQPRSEGGGGVWWNPPPPPPWLWDGVKRPGFFRVKIAFLSQWKRSDLTKHLTNFPIPNILLIPWARQEQTLKGG